MTYFIVLSIGSLIIAIALIVGTVKVVLELKAER
mgnify:CR=1 FL=1